MEKYTKVLKDILTTGLISTYYDVKTNGRIEQTITYNEHDNRIRIKFIGTRPTIIGKMIVRIKLPIDYIDIDNENIYVKPDGFMELPISIKDLT